MTEPVAGPPSAPRRWPVWPTIIVVLAAAAMVMLGVWQLQRKGEKEALIALFAANMANAQPVSFPELPPVGDEFLYRQSSVTCLEPVRWDTPAGTDRDGRKGFRLIAHCRTGAEGPGVLVAVGVSDDFSPPAWRGGTVTGIIVPGPGQSTVLDQLLGRAVPARAMLIADVSPVPGLRASAVPDPGDVPNNHLAYAGQWFLFAGLALLIYILAVRRRLQR